MPVTWTPGGEYSDIRYELSGDGIAKITINRPEVRNAFRPQTVIELSQAFERAREDPSVGVIILTGEGDKAVAVPRDAILYEGEAARVWVVRDKDNEKAIELRRIKVGLTNGSLVEVLKGLAPGDRVVTKGSLFIDRVAAGT